MRTVEVAVSEGTQQRLDRIRTLRSQSHLTDEEVFIAAVSAYWLLLEQPSRRNKK